MEGLTSEGETKACSHWSTPAAQEQQGQWLVGHQTLVLADWTIFQALTLTTQK